MGPTIDYYLIDKTFGNTKHCNCPIVLPIIHQNRY